MSEGLQHTGKPPLENLGKLQLPAQELPRGTALDIWKTQTCAGSSDGRFLPTAWILFFFFKGLESTAQKCGVYDENAARLLSAAIPGLVTAQWRAGASVIRTAN